MTTTIPKNATRKIAAIKEKALICHVYTLRNNFHATECDVEYAWEELYRYAFAKLSVGEKRGETVWTIQVHSNLWYELKERAS